jgi:hypothetical protein
MKITGWIALIFMVFEVAQLVLALRFIGIEQIRRNQHPLDAPSPHSFWFSATWVTAILADYAFQATLLLMPLPLLEPREWVRYIKAAAFLMIFASFVGFVVRRRCGVKWGLVVMTFEGALRLGFFGLVFNLLALNSALMPWLKYQQ